MAIFTIKKRVYYHDTDCGGVVYYSNYLKYFEEARTEHLLSKGIDLREAAKEGFFFVVAGVEIKYKSPARYGDNLTIQSKIEGLGTASINFRHKAERDGRLLIECETKLVSVDLNLRPARIPQKISVLLNKQKNS